MTTKASNDFLSLKCQTLQSNFDGMVINMWGVTALR